MKKSDIMSAKGTIDLVGPDLMVRKFVIEQIRSQFEKMDAIELETSVIENWSVVDSMYGEEFNKQVYRLSNPNPNKPSKEILRYDLTVPLARYCASRGITALRRYQIGKVYRRDNPSIQTGRFREFYQCDFDIVGDDFGSGMNDWEMIDLLIRVLDKLLGNNTYQIKINNKQILTDVLRKIGIPDEKMNTVCSTIDKLDKIGWDGVYDELLQKGIDTSIPSKFKEIVENLSNLIFEEAMKYLLDFTSPNVIESFSKLIKMVAICNDNDNNNNNNNLTQTKLVFDLTLARGMDYYTGIIYEATYLDKNIMPSSIAAGGRYDGMIGKLAKKNVPAIGLSFGVERIVTILEKTFQINIPIPLIYIATIGNSPLVFEEKIRVCSELRKMGVSVLTSNKRNPKMGAQMNTVLERNIPFMIIIGESEIIQCMLKIKNMITKEELLLGRQTVLDYFTIK